MLGEGILEGGEGKITARKRQDKCGGGGRGKEEAAEVRDKGMGKVEKLSTE